MRQFPGQLTIFDALRSSHAVKVVTTRHRYLVDGMARSLTWDKIVCTCGRPGCTEPWRRE